MTKPFKVRCKILPIYIVKRNADNTKTLNQKKINFQVNFGNVYHISYKYFTPKGYQVASDSEKVVTCRYDHNGINVPSITFTYVQTVQAKPIHVSYIDVNNNQRIRTGLASGKYGQKIDVTKFVMIPKNYTLIPDQKTEFKINEYIQSIDLMVKSVPQTKPAKAAKPKSNPTSQKKSDADVTVQPKKPLSDSFAKSITTLENSLQQYNCNLSVELIQEVMHHSLGFFKKVIESIFTNMKYKGVNNLTVTPKEHKVSGVIKKYLYNNNQVNFTFIRAKQAGLQSPITVSQVRDFVTSVMDHNCSKGIFITTSHFTSKAKKEAERHSIILINDVHLARLMINNNVGIKPKRILKVVDLDKDFFK